MLADVRNAVRALRAAPGFTAVVLVVLTVGIGATTAVFSVVDAVVLRGVPFDEGDRLVSAGTRSTTSTGFGGSQTPQDYADFRRLQDVFAGLAAVAGGGGFTVRDSGHPEELNARRVTAELFDVLRVRPALGATFTTGNEVDGNHLVAVISDGLWRRRFGANPAIVGRTMTFDSGTYMILGVMPRGFTYPIGSSTPVELWVPFVVPKNQVERGNSRSYYLQVVGRLKDGVTLEQARSRMDAITAGLAAEFPNWFRNRAAYVVSLHESLVGRVRTWMLMLLGAVAFVLLIACVNVANLMLARATSRSQETVVRAALGAGRWQIARSLMAESLVLAAVGTMGGVLLAVWGVDVLRAALPRTLPRISEVGIDLRVLVAAALSAITTGLLFGLAPAIQFSRPSLSGALREGSRGTAGGSRQWLRSMLVTVEVALAMVLLVGAGLFVSSFVRLVNVDIGLDYRGVLTVGVYPRINFADRAEFQAGMARAAVTLPEIVQRVQAIPGVDAAGLIANGLPLSGSWSRTSVTVPGVEEEFDGDDSVDIRGVTAGYGAAIRAEVRRGRYIEDTDTKSSAAVVVLNEEAAKRYLGGQDPLGRTIGINGDRTVVGVVGDVRLGGPESAVRPEAYVPLVQDSVVGGELAIRTSGDPAALVPAVRDAIWATLPDIAIPEAVTMETLLQRLIAQRRFNMLLVGLFGVLAIVIAAAGIYGVMAYLVTQRTQEIGVRMALGAPRERIVLMVLARAALFLVLGVGVGLVGAGVLAGTIESFLFDVTARELSVYGIVAVLLLVSGLLAALVPALRASRIDPLVALK